MSSLIVAASSSAGCVEPEKEKLRTQLLPKLHATIIKINKLAATIAGFEGVTTGSPDSYASTRRTETLPKFQQAFEELEGFIECAISNFINAPSWNLQIVRQEFLTLYSAEREKGPRSEAVGKISESLRRLYTQLSSLPDKTELAQAREEIVHLRAALSTQLSKSMSGGCYPLPDA